MSDLQRIVDDLRFLIQQNPSDASDHFINLLNDYSQQCREANERLRRCEDYLKQGLRSEALHLAEAAPNLLDVIATLDFQEHDELLGLISTFHLESSEPLLLEVASSLNEAYAIQEPLKKLLDTHRLLALGRKPLPLRLSVLRSLAEHDSASPHWDDDIREMERARQSEMVAECRAAATRKDVAALKSLVTEAQAAGWREAIPAAILSELKSRSNQAGLVNARQRMEEINAELYEAFSALDASRARSLREEWIQIQKRAQINESDTLWDEIGPIFAWLEDEDRNDAKEQAFARGIGDIERALERNELTSADLKRLRAKFDRCERSMPDLLESRFRNRLSSLEIAETRRHRVLIGAGVSAFVFIAGLFGVIVYASNEAEKMRRVATAVSVFIDEGKLVEARKLFEQHPGNTGSEAWLAVQKRLVDAEQSEKSRIVRWQDEIETGRQSIDSGQADAALKRARDLSRTPEEKIEVSKLQSGLQKRISEEISKREQHFRDILASAGKSLQAIDTALGRESNSESQSRLRQLFEEAGGHIGQLTPLKTTVAQELSSQATLLESRLQAYRKTAEDIEKKISVIERLTEAALVPRENIRFKTAGTKYIAVLKEYSSAFPTDPRSMSLQEAAMSCPLPMAIAHQVMLENWKQLYPRDVKDSEERFREIRSFLTDHPESPDRELLSRYESWLASIQRRFADDGDPEKGVVRRMATLFNSKFIKEGHILRDTDGHTFYLVEPQKAPFGSLATFPYQVGFKGEIEKISLKPEKLLSHKSEPPPQQKIADRVKKVPPDTNLGKWPNYYQELAESLLANHQIDPFLRYLLVLKTLEFASLGDQFLEDELAPILEKLSDDELDRSVAWMDPFSKTAEKARVQATELLSQLPPLELVFEKAQKRQLKFERELFFRRYPIGWLEMRTSQEWACRTRWSGSGNASLYVVSRSDGKNARNWMKLGQMQGKSIMLDPIVAASVGEAAIVFAATPVGDN